MTQKSIAHNQRGSIFFTYSHIYIHINNACGTTNDSTIQQNAEKPARALSVNHKQRHARLKYICIIYNEKIEIYLFLEWHIKRTMTEKYVFICGGHPEGIFSNNPKLSRLK